MLPADAGTGFRFSVTQDHDKPERAPPLLDVYPLEPPADVTSRMFEIAGPGVGANVQDAVGPRRLALEAPADDLAAG